MADKFEDPEDYYYVNDSPSPVEADGTIVVSRRKVRREQTRFNIDSFRSEINRGGVVSTHSYLVTFSKPNITSATGSPLSKFIEENGSILAMRCDSAILPGVRLLKDETIRRFGYGPIERVPYAVQFNDLTLNWVMDSRGKVLEFFNQWMNMIINFDSAGTRDMETTKRVGNLDFSPYEVGYKDDYVIPKMNIFVYDQESDQVVIYEVFDVFPSAINDVPVNWAEQDTPLRYSIEFSYTDINIITPKTSDDIPERLRRDFAEIDSQFNNARYSEFIGAAGTVIGSALSRLFKGSF